ncbi:hypothetical protein B484DRAFT_334980 [Ochromonadaceae sp. CCMP2298]|nr:hypothetical protein B484DRAFT_334980 [Ochromonadaceae sp. CCMP2298]
MAAIFVLLLLICHIQFASAAWPITSLKCFSSMTQVDNRLICPEARTAYCVKEISSLTQDLCGKSQYFGDIYANAQCEYRKCSDHCTAGTEIFEFEGQTYSRDRYCCKSDYCNSATSTRLPYFLALLSVSALALYLAL